MEILVGEIYGKQLSPSKFAMYNVLQVKKSAITLQNIDNPLSLFETTAEKLKASGYILVSQTPYIDTESKNAKKKRALKKPSRCPYTLDFLAERADNQKPEPIIADLFSEA